MRVFPNWHCILLPPHPTIAFFSPYITCPFCRLWPFYSNFFVSFLNNSSFCIVLVSQDSSVVWCVFVLIERSPPSVLGVWWRSGCVLFSFSSQLLYPHKHAGIQRDMAFLRHSYTASPFSIAVTLLYLPQFYVAISTYTYTTMLPKLYRSTTMHLPNLYVVSSLCIYVSAAVQWFVCCLCCMHILTSCLFVCCCCRCCCTSMLLPACLY